MAYGQGRLFSILGPGQSSALGPLSMQTLTGINCKCSIKLNIYFLYWYFQQNQYLDIKKHAVYYIHRLVYGVPLLVGPPG